MPCCARGVAFTLLPSLYCSWVWAEQTFSVQNKRVLRSTNAQSNYLTTSYITIMRVIVYTFLPSSQPKFVRFGAASRFFFDKLGRSLRTQLRLLLLLGLPLCVSSLQSFIMKQIRLKNNNNNKKKLPASRRQTTTTRGAILTSLTTQRSPAL